MRRNPVIADLFHRMKYMERRGSGLRKILTETAKQPGYSDDLKPEFVSSPLDFKVILKNLNYNLNGSTIQDTIQVNIQESRHIDLIEFCSLARTRGEMQQFIGIANRDHFRKAYLKPILESGQVQMVFPDKPNSPNQKYVKV